MSVCNHGKGKSCDRCYPVYDDKIEAKLLALNESFLEFSKALKKGYDYGGGVSGDSTKYTSNPLVKPLTPIHRVKKNIGKRIKGVRVY